MKNEFRVNERKSLSLSTEPRIWAGKKKGVSEGMRPYLAGYRNGTAFWKTEVAKEANEVAKALFYEAGRQGFRILWTCGNNENEEKVWLPWVENTASEKAKSYLSSEGGTPYWVHPKTIGEIQEKVTSGEFDMVFVTNPNTKKAQEAKRCADVANIPTIACLDRSWDPRSWTRFLPISKYTVGEQQRAFFVCYFAYYAGRVTGAMEASF